MVSRREKTDALCVCGAFHASVRDALLRCYGVSGTGAHALVARARMCVATTGCALRTFCAASNRNQTKCTRARIGGGTVSERTSSNHSHPCTRVTRCVVFNNLLKCAQMLSPSCFSFQARLRHLRACAGLGALRQD